MILTTVHVRVKPGMEKAFIEATRRNHEGSLREPGCLRFDVLRQREDPTRFILYEAFESDAAAAAHKETPHYKAWRDAVAGMMAEPRRGVPHDVVYPLDREAW